MTLQKVHFINVLTVNPKTALTVKVQVFSGSLFKCGKWGGLSLIKDKKQRTSEELYGFVIEKNNNKSITPFIYLKKDTLKV